MDEMMELGKILVRVNQDIVEMYKNFAAAISDENLRKFLRMLIEQKESTQRLIRDNASLLDGIQDNEGQLIDQINRIESDHLPIDRYRELTKVEILQKIFEFEGEIEKIFDRCYQMSETTERKDLFYSLLEDTKKQRALLRDRYELEQLL